MKALLRMVQCSGTTRDARQRIQASRRAQTATPTIAAMINGCNCMERNEGTR